MHIILFLTSFDVLNCMVCLVKLYKCWLCISPYTTIFLFIDEYLLWISLQGG